MNEPMNTITAYTNHIIRRYHMSKSKSIPFLSVVMLTNFYKEELKKRNNAQVIKDLFFIYLGEIPNMRGHCVVLGYTSNTVYSGYHIENFRLPNENEF